MSDYPYIYLKSSKSLPELVQIMISILGPMEANQAQDGRYYLNFGWYWFVVGTNRFPRRDALPADWFPPFDSYNFESRLEVFKDKDLAMPEAKKIFEILKTKDIWSLSLSWEFSEIMDRYYPATPEGDEARRIDEAEAAIVPLPSHNRTIFIQSDADLRTLGADLGAVLGSNWTNSQVIDNLTKEVATFFSYTEAKSSLGVNEKYSPKQSTLLQPSPSGLYKYSLYMRDYEGPVEQLKNANFIFERLKAVGKWSLLLVEDNEKVLNRFDPAGS